MTRRQVGPVGYLACGIASLVAAVVSQGWRSVLAFGLAVALAVALYRDALPALCRRRFWLFTGLLIVSSALFLREEGPSWQGLTLSDYGLLMGIQMAFRAAAIMVAVTGVTDRVGVAQFAAILERWGLLGLGFALGVAVSALPFIGETWRNAAAALRLRGGFRRERLRALRQLLLTTLTNSLLYGEQVVAAAEARAYSPARAHPLPLNWSPIDLMLAGGLVFVVALLRLA